jgi:hypothetical protein
MFLSKISRNEEDKMGKWHTCSCRYGALCTDCIDNNLKEAAQRENIKRLEQSIEMLNGKINSVIRESNDHLSKLDAWVFNEIGLLKNKIDSANYAEFIKQVNGWIERQNKNLREWRDKTEIKLLEVKVNKQPHKCPVCEGKYIAIFNGCECACLTCDKGIVWG